MIKKSSSKKPIKKGFSLGLLQEDGATETKRVPQKNVQLCLLGNSELALDKDESKEAIAGVVRPFEEEFNRIPQNLRATIVAESMVVPKNALGIMEFPFLGLAKRPSKFMSKFTYNGSEIKMSPFIERDVSTGKETNYGLPTIYDFDVIIFIYSLLMKGMNEGMPPSRMVTFKIIDFCRFVSKTPVRSVSGKKNQMVKDALVRLRTASISTNIKSARQPKNGPTRYRSTNMFNFIDSLSMEFGGKDKKYVSSVSVELSSWLYAYVMASDVLSIAPDYFQMSGLHRAMYNHFRKHCGEQDSYAVTVDVLKTKLSVKRKIGWFKKEIHRVAEADKKWFVEHGSEDTMKTALSGYSLHFCEKTKKITAFNLNKKNGVALYGQSLFSVR